MQMTTQERYEDIAKKSGLSVDIIKRVLIAERESVIESLKKGERATLVGRCAIKPEIKSKLVIGGKLEKYIDLKSEITPSLKTTLEELGEFEDSDLIDNYDDTGIRLRQIPSLI